MGDRQQTFDWRNEESRDEAVRKALSKMSMSASVSQTCFSRSLTMVWTQLWIAGSDRKNGKEDGLTLSAC